MFCLIIQHTVERKFLQRYSYQIKSIHNFSKNIKNKNMNKASGLHTLIFNETLNERMKDVAD